MNLMLQTQELFMVSQSAPARRDALAKEALDVDSRRVVEVLEMLPVRVPGKWVVCCYLIDNPGHDLCGMF